MKNSEIRTRARQDLGGSLFHRNWLTALAICLVAEICTNFIRLLSNGSSNRSSVFWALAGLLVSIVIGGCIAYGLSMTFLNKLRGADQFEFSDLFTGFHMFVDCFVLNLMRSLLIGLWFLIPIAGLYFGIKKAYSYCLCSYVLVDHPEFSWKECLDHSTQLMEGARWKCFCLEFSFVGWALLGLLACGIGILWVAPYFHASMANFYEDRKRSCGETLM